MKKSIMVDRSLTPDGGEISLHCHDGSYAIRVNGQELMSTRQSFSEEHLARVVCEPFASRDIDVLVGGLGLGFTLKSVLENVTPASRVVVAELMESVIKWNQDANLPLAHAALSDPRVDVHQTDVMAIIQAGNDQFDAIILDVDNGPEAYTVKSNHAIYCQEGLVKIRRALKTGGILGIWSVGEHPLFLKLMQNCGYKAESIKSRARQGKGSVHTLFVGRTGPSLHSG